MARTKSESQRQAAPADIKPPDTPSSDPATRDQSASTGTSQKDPVPAMQAQLSDLAGRLDALIERVRACAGQQDLDDLVDRLCNEDRDDSVQRQVRRLGEAVDGLASRVAQ